VLDSSHFRSISTVLSVFFVLGFLLAGSARATELYLSNGDRITGQFLRRADGKIYFRSPILGEISVPENQAAVVEPPETPVDSLAGLPPSHGSTSHPAGGSVPSSKSEGVPWKGTLEFGFQQQSGRTNALTFSFHGVAEKKKGANDYKAEARVLYGKQEGITATDRSDASFRYRHELSERVFSQSLTSYSQDRIKLINSDYEENAGFGYRLFQRKRDTANVGAGLTAQYREVVGGKAGMAYLGQLFEDYTYKINGRLTFTQDSSLLSAFRGTNNTTVVNDQVIQTTGERQNWRFRFNSALQGRMTDRISLNLRFEYEFDNSIAVKSARADNRITTSLGYGF
jgi:putative salt-induced outer membrane protein YdiY